MIAVLLAGGKGTRLGNTGRFLPKPLIHVGAEPVINYLVEKLLLYSDKITSIYVLTKKKQIIELDSTRKRELDLFTAFEKWKEVWYPKNEIIKVFYEEDLPPLDVYYDKEGAILGLYRFQKYMEENNIKDSLIILAADNYIEDDLSALFEEVKNYPDAIINAYFNFNDKEKIRRKYGCIEVDDNNWITNYEEKPEDPSLDQTKASTAVYVFSVEEFRKLENYMKTTASFEITDVVIKNLEKQISDDKLKTLQSLINKNKRFSQTEINDRLEELNFIEEEITIVENHAKIPKYGVDAPGNLIKWFVNDIYSYHETKSEDLRNKGTGVRCYPLNGEWFDIGRKSDLIAAIKYYVDHFLMEMSTVEDLLLAERTDSLTDKYFLLCHHISVEPEKGIIRLMFKGKDKICKLDVSLAGNIPTIKDIKSSSQKASYWDDLLKSIEERTQGFDMELNNPILISCGVFLFDSIGGQIIDNRTRLPRERTLIPLLEKDPGSPTDAGRLTTPAGRIEKLNIRQTCYEELSEEMIFYGVRQNSNTLRFLAIAPFEIRNVKRRILKRILEKNIFIPGIDKEKIVVYSRLPEKDISIVDIIPPSDMALPSKIAWSIEMYLDNDCQSICDNVIVIPDKNNGTLEFRVACYADITGTQTNEKPVWNPFSKQIGNLLGIADGDGYSRRPFLISASELLNYYKKMRLRTKSDILQYLMNSQYDSVNIAASGNPNTGRFENFNCHMPVLSLTTSVKYLAELLNYLF